MSQTMEDEYDPSGDDADVLDVIRDEGRANPYLIRQRTGLGKGDVNTILVRLAQYGHIQKVTRGLYEYNAEGRDCRDAVLEARAAVTDALDEIEMDNGQAAQGRMESALEVLNEVDV